MSSSERWFQKFGRLQPGRNRGRWSVVVAAALAVGLAGCSAQPLYAPNYNGQVVTSVLERIDVEPVDTRIAQQVRNKLLFDLNSRTNPEQATYQMRLAVSATESPLGVTPVDSAPAYTVIVATTYTIRSIESGDIVLRETVRASASYDRVNQVYSNVRAQRDAENRAATTVANDIRIRLAAAAAESVI